MFENTLLLKKHQNAGKVNVLKNLIFVNYYCLS